MNYKVDVDAIRAIEPPAGLSLPLKLVPAAYKLDETAYEDIRKTNTKFFELLSDHITATPAKVAVSLKLA